MQGKKNWRQHMPNRPRKVTKNYYRQKTINKKQIVKKIILFILTILLIQSIFQLPFLKINRFVLLNNQDLQLSDLQPVIDQYLSEDKYLIFSNSNYFLLDQDVLANKLLETYNLDSIKIKKRFPQTIEITVSEKISQFILQKDDAIYLLSAKGLLNRQINDLDEKYLILQDLRTSSLNLDQMLSDQELELVNLLATTWQDVFYQSPKLKKILLTNSINVLLEGQTDLGYLVKLDPQEDIKSQLENLKKVLAGNIVGIDIDYIDLRFGERVFFK